MPNILFTLALLLLPVSVMAKTVLATVDGVEITQEMLESYALQRGAPSRDAINADQKRKLLKELIDRELLYKEAVNQGLDKTRHAKSEIDSARRNILASMVIRNLNSADKAITEQMLKDAYNDFVKTLSNKESKARHILVSSREIAEALIKELDKGADFAKLAGEKSEGPSKTAGGDLGWFRAEEMVPPFAEALGKLKKGHYTKTPVQTQFGWHIILLEDTRAIEPPPFESLKKQLHEKVSNDRISDYLKSLNDKAKIVISK